MRRSRRRADWPRGLYEPRAGYYVWRHPDGRTFVVGRVSFAVARNEALAANAHVSGQKPGLVARIDGSGHTFADLLGKMPAAKAANSAKQWRTHDRKALAVWRDRLVGSIAVQDVAELLEAQGEHLQSARGLRSRLVRVFKRGQALGWIASNPAQVTDNPAPVVKRGRLTLQAFTAIRDAGPSWFQHAMNLALVLGMDAATLCTLDDSALVDAGGERCIVYRRVKTKRTVCVPLRLRLDVAGLDLASLVLASPRHGSWARPPRKHGNADEDITPARLSKAFTAARRAVGLAEASAGGPSFHEIRSLAKRLYKAQGNVDTLELLGHDDKRSGELYADPRDVRPEPVRVT